MKVKHPFILICVAIAGKVLLQQIFNANLSLASRVFFVGLTIAFILFASFLHAYLIEFDEEMRF